MKRKTSFLRKLREIAIGTPGKNRYLKTNSNGLLAYKYFNPIDIKKTI